MTQYFLATTKDGIRSRVPADSVPELRKFIVEVMSKEKIDCTYIWDYHQKFIAEIRASLFEQFKPNYRKQIQYDWHPKDGRHGKIDPKTGKLISRWGWVN
ncbi:MAG: hypothetical protein IIY21_06110 [Clostridiales bacterium]|nr:hypothetical protein [Clostridiales bacterium]